MLVAVAVLAAAVSAVFADAPDPVPAAARVRVGDTFVVNGVPVVRVSVSGGWQWPTHHTDCNTDRTGAGYAIDWADPNQPGNHVTTLSGIGSIDVGAASANAYNGAAAGWETFGRAGGSLRRPATARSLICGKRLSGR